MNLDKEIKNLRGEFIMMSFPSRKEIEKLSKNDKGQPNLDKLPNETIRNVMLNCLSNYQVENR